MLAKTPDGDGEWLQSPVAAMQPALPVAHVLRDGVLVVTENRSDFETL
jgi:hypothetical protein